MEGAECGLELLRVQVHVQVQLDQAAERVLECLDPSAGPMSFKGPVVKDSVSVMRKVQSEFQDHSFASPAVRKALTQLLGALAAGVVPPEQRSLAWSISLGFFTLLPHGEADSVLHKCVSLTRSVNTLELNLEGIVQKYVVKNPLQFTLGFWAAFLQTAVPLSEANNIRILDFFQDVCCHSSRIACEAFRVLHKWLLRFEEEWSLPKDHADTVFDLICCNWEHPVSGVRKEILKALNALLSIRTSEPYAQPVSFVKYILKTQTWSMKSKFYCLAVVIPKCNLQTLSLEPLVEGLVKSLAYNHLVNPGADLYQACLSIIPNEETWSYYFAMLFDDICNKKKTDLTQQNLVSYWLPVTIRRFPGVTHTLLRMFIDFHQDHKGHLYVAALFHFGYKEGYLDERWEKEMMEKYKESFDKLNCIRSLLKGFLAHANPDVRKHAFAAVCKRTKTSIVPSGAEFETVKQFLVENVNASDTPLRHSIVNSFSYFLKCLHDSALRSLSVKENCDSVFSFLSWLYEFLIGNLQLGSNYQRRITSLQLYLEVLRAFGPGEVLNIGTAQQIRAAADGSWKFASEECWHYMFACICDPTDDIQKVAAEILSKHLSKEISAAEQERQADILFRKALCLCRSPLFYEAESAAIIVQILIRLPRHKLLTVADKPLQKSSTMQDTTSAGEASHKDLEETKTELESKSGLPLVDQLLELTFQQWRAVQDDFYKATTSDSPLHGVLGTLTLLVPYFSQQCSENLLTLMNNIVDFYLSQLSSRDCDDSVSPSFAEMSEAIENIIPDDYQGKEGELSPCHQLLLNCTWLTIKTCCSLASSLTCAEKTSGDIAAKCFFLIRNVLMRCRHKGAIEAAGASLSTMVRHVTSKTDKKTFTMHSQSFQLQELPGLMLKEILNDLGRRAAKTSVTRRSAGIGIFVHKIVASDARGSKPLLQDCINTLLERVKYGKQGHSEPPSFSTDLPQSSALHLLCRIVQDSTLRQDVVPHASFIAYKCLRTISSSVWTIKNAALQLFGALVPLLIGEKKVSDDEEEEFAYISAEEFLCHHPNIGKLLIELLSCMTAPLSHPKHTSNMQKRNSDAVPILSFLSKLTLGRLPLRMEHIIQSIKYICRHLHKLCSDSCAEVRRLAAKTKARFLGFWLLRDEIRTHIEELRMLYMKPENLNIVDGHLLTLKYMLVWHVKQLYYNKSEKSALVQIFDSVGMLHCSWMNKLLFTELKRIAQSGIEMQEFDLMKVVDIYIRSPCTGIGFKQYVLAETARVVAMHHPMCLSDAWCVLEQCNSPAIDEVFLRIVNERIPMFKYEANCLLFGCLLKVVLSDEQKTGRIEAVLPTLLLLLHYTGRCVIEDHSKEMYRQYATYGPISTIWSFALPVACGLLWKYQLYCSNWKRKHGFDLKFFIALVEHIRARTSAAHCDAQIRMNGACAFVFLYKALIIVTERLPEDDYENGVMMLLDCGIMYLQDESAEVREEAAKISEQPENSFKCLLKLLSVEGLKDVLKEDQAARYIYGKFKDFKSYEKLLAELQENQHSDETTVSVSPFDHGTSNIYAEERHVLEQIREELLLLSSLKKLDTITLPSYEYIHNLVSELLPSVKSVKKIRAPLAATLQCLVIQLQGLSQLCQELSLSENRSDATGYSYLAKKVAIYAEFQVS